MTLSYLYFVVFLDHYQGSNDICLLSKCHVRYPVLQETPRPRRTQGDRARAGQVQRVAEPPDFEILRKLLLP